MDNTEALNKKVFGSLGYDPGTVFIAMSGKKQTGKDTSALILQKLLNRGDFSVEITAFAEAIKKDIGVNILGLDEDLIYGSDEDKKTLTDIFWNNFPIEIRRDRTGPMTIRDVLQVTGTEIFRNMYHKDIWANVPFNRKHDADIVILTDARFPNEIRRTEAQSGIIIRVERDTDFDDEHASEIALDNYDFKYVYQNNGSFKELEDFLLEVLEKEGLIL